MKNLAIILLPFMALSSAQYSIASSIERINPKGVVNTSHWGFSQAVVAPSNGHFIFISGQYSGNEKGEIVGDTMQTQVMQTYKNLKKVILGAGGKPENVVQIRTLVKDYRPEHVNIMLDQSRKLFGDNLPASTLIAVPALAIPGMLFEMEATVFVPDNAN